MTNKKIFRVLILAAFAAMIVIAPLQAAQGCQKQGDQKKMMGQGCMAGQGCMMLKNIPNLSDEQKAKLEKLHAEHQKLMPAAKADMEKLHAEMQGLMKDPVDIKKVEAKIDEAAKMKADMMKKCLAHRLAVKALLTDEQKAKLGEMGCGMGCGMRGAMMHGQGCCKMGPEKKTGECGMMKKERKMDHSACQKAAEEKKEEKK
jgi:Spy/CpxP family protein refolding chaperone